MHCCTPACCDVLQPCCACARPPVTPAPSLPALYASHITCTHLSSAHKDAGPITMGSFVGGLGCHAVAGCHAVTGRKCALRHVALLVALLLRVQGGVGALCHLSHCGKRGQTLLQAGNRVPSCCINCISTFRALGCDGRPVQQLRRQCQGARSHRMAVEIILLACPPCPTLLAMADGVAIMREKAWHSAQVDVPASPELFPATIASSLQPPLHVLRHGKESSSTRSALSAQQLHWPLLSMRRRGI